jgi:AcrR family transcriptional regulator
VVVDVAMGLFATMPVDEVTIQDIATVVEMTPAAIYYHFASKDQILVEGMKQFRERMLDELRSQLSEPGDPGGVGALLAHMVAWTAKHRTPATVYFVSSIGLNLTVEALRRDARVRMVELLRVAVRSARGPLGDAEAGVIAVSLVSLLETSLASMLNQDAAYRGIGARRFGAQVAAIGERVAGVDVSR